MYTILMDNHTGRVQLNPIYDSNCDYLISPNLHIGNYMKCYFANIYGNVQVDGFATIYQDLTLYGNLNLIHGNITDYTGEVRIYDSMVVNGDAINDSLVVCQNSTLKEIAVFKNETTDIMVISPDYNTTITGNLDVSANVITNSNINIIGNGRIRNSVGNLDPSIGDLKMSVRSSDYDGWLLCDGRALSTVTYSQLFSLIGYTFGGSGGSFLLPSSGGRVLGSSNGSYPIGTATGSSTATLSTTNVPAHTHSGTTSTIGNHAHTYYDAYFAENRSGGQNNLYGTTAGIDEDNSFIWRTADGKSSIAPSPLATSADGSHSHTFTTDNGTGSATPFSIIQPTLFIGYTFIYSGV